MCISNCVIALQYFISCTLEQNLYIELRSCDVYGVVDLMQLEHFCSQFYNDISLMGSSVFIFVFSRTECIRTVRLASQFD